ncbi:MAG: surface-adhesin E family protein [Methylotenera sp.]
MRKVILMLLLAVMSNSAMAKWIYVAGSDESSFYADISTIRKSGNIVKMWTLSDKNENSNDGKWQSYKSLGEYDCKEEKTRSISKSSFSKNMGGGEVLYTSLIGKWSPIPPNSIGAGLWKVACGTEKISEAALSDSTLNKWTLIDSGENFDTYADFSAINMKKKKTANKEKIKKDSNIKIWLIYDEKTIQESNGRAYLSSKFQEEIDCKENDFKILKRALYTEKMGNGNIVRNFDFTSTRDWTPIAPESMTAGLKKTVCGDR